MAARKKILSILIKTLVGIGSLALIWWRLQGEFTREKLGLLQEELFSARGVLCLAGCIFLIPLNWGIESYKWKVITAPVQWISFRTAIKSVCSGVCLGNLAPGRATEFLAKIFYFKPDNRSKVTVLHFVGGLFQLSVTIVAGLMALLTRLKDFEGDYSWIGAAVPVAAGIMLILMLACIYKIDAILHFVSGRFSKSDAAMKFHYRFSNGSLLQLFGFSVLRYAVFVFQFYLLIMMFSAAPDAGMFSGIALYFLITSVMPMISALEPAIRAAVALVVFHDSGLSETVLALCSILLWIMNIVVPSVAGYYFLVRQNFNFKISKKTKT